MDWPAFRAAISDAGMYIGGGLTLSADEVSVFAPGGTGAAPSAGKALLIGNTGPDMWEVFAAEGQDGQADALDRWTRNRLDIIAGQYGCRPVYPFAGPPWPPFGQWALRTGRFFDSPLGLKIHPDHGLWQAFRAVFVLPAGTSEPDGSTDEQFRSPCDACPDQPCLSACPVGAFTLAGYDTSACRNHISGAGSVCLGGGCLARHACPVGQNKAYRPDHASFHMRSFLGS